MIGQVDDTLAAGATLEELEADMVCVWPALNIMQMHWMTSPHIQASVSRRGRDRARFSSLKMLEDGGIFALR